MTHYPKRRLAWAALCAGLVAALAAAAPPVLAQSKLKVAFPTTPTTLGLPHYVAQDLGLFKKNGLEIEDLTVVGDANTIRALVSGQVDLAHSGTFPVFGAVANGAPIKAIGSLQPIADYQLVAQGKFKTLKDLESARIAAASIGGLTTAIPGLLMKKYGLDPNKMKFTSIGGHEARLQAVLANKLDATIVSNLFAAMGQKLGDVAIVTSIAKEFPGLGYIYIVATDNGLADAGKRKAMELYVETTIQAARYIVKNPAEAAKIMKTRTPEIEQAIVAGAVAALNDDNVWPLNGGLDREVTDFTLKFALDYGQLKGVVKSEQILDRRIVDAVMARIGRF